MPEMRLMVHCPFKLLFTHTANIVQPAYAGLQAPEREEIIISKAQLTQTPKHQSKPTCYNTSSIVRIIASQHRHSPDQHL